ncbi:[ribosomal protein S5]-alanine N-acetyltransferase [Microdochium nivale]|nr:[ribosomal protein S5]-alanine N-acetyltransferase [Microdochium nivale]
MADSTQLSVVRQEQQQQQPTWLTSPPPKPIISAPRFYIRAYTLHDAPLLAQAGNSPEIAHRMGDRFPAPYRLADAEFFITKFGRPDPENGMRDYNFGIFAPRPTTTNPGGGDDAGEEEQQQLLGGIGLMPQAAESRHTFEVGYWLARPAWGRGLATEVVREFVSWAFATFGPAELARIQARHHGGNERSGRVLVKNGFAREGVLRRAWACRDDGDVARAAEVAAAAAAAAEAKGKDKETAGDSGSGGGVIGEREPAPPAKHYILDLYIYGLLREDFEVMDKARLNKESTTEAAPARV